MILLSWYLVLFCDFSSVHIRKSYMLALIQSCTNFFEEMLLKPDFVTIKRGVAEAGVLKRLAHLGPLLSGPTVAIKGHCPAIPTEAVYSLNSPPSPFRAQKENQCYISYSYFN